MRRWMVMSANAIEGVDGRVAGHRHPRQRRGMGLVLAALSCGSIVGITSAGSIVTRRGARFVVAVGLGAIVAGLGLMADRHRRSPTTTPITKGTRP